jgi:hypothetical protein
MQQDTAWLPQMVRAFPYIQAQILHAPELRAIAADAGYYTLSAFCFAIGVLWIYYFTPESGDESAWRVRKASDGPTRANKTANKKG